MTSKPNWNQFPANVDEMVTSLAEVLEWERVNSRAVPREWAIVPTSKFFYDFCSRFRWVEYAVTETEEIRPEDV